MDVGNNDKYDDDNRNNLKQRTLSILNRLYTCDVQKFKTPRN
jgi:hypothetical protein